MRLGWAQSGHTHPSPLFRRAAQDAFPVCFYCTHVDWNYSFAVAMQLPTVLRWAEGGLRWVKGVPNCKSAFLKYRLLEGLLSETQRPRETWELNGAGSGRNHSYPCKESLLTCSCSRRAEDAAGRASVVECERRHTRTAQACMCLCVLQRPPQKTPPPSLLSTAVGAIR